MKRPQRCSPVIVEFVTLDLYGSAKNDHEKLDREGVQNVHSLEEKLKIHN